MDAAARPRGAAAPAPKVIAASNAAPLSLAALRAAEAIRVRTAYERLCTGDGMGAASTCATLRLEMEKAGTPGTKGWMGLVVGAPDQGVTAVRVFAMAPGSPARTAGVRVGDVIVAFDGDPVSDANAFVKAIQASLVGQQVSLRILRGETVLDLPVKLAAEPGRNPKLNSQRGEKSRYSLWSGTEASVDPMSVGEVFDGIIEKSDGGDGRNRADCIELPLANGSQNLRAQLTPNGTWMRIFAMSGVCNLSGSTNGTATDAAGKQTAQLDFASQAGSKTYLLILGAPSAQPYQLVVREQTPSETQAWSDRIRQQRIAEQQQREQAQRDADNRQMMFGAIVTGLASGLSGVEVPMGGNPLESLNAINSVMQQRNLESADRLNETIARAQAQAEQQQRNRIAAEAAAQVQRDTLQRQQASRPSAPNGGIVVSPTQAARPVPTNGGIVVSQTPAPRPQPAPPPAPVSRPAAPPVTPVAAPAPSKTPSYPPRSCSTTTSMQSRTKYFPYMAGVTKGYQEEGRAEMVANVRSECEGGVMNTYSCKGGGIIGDFTCQVSFSCPVKKTTCTGGPPSPKVSAQ